MNEGSPKPELLTLTVEESWRGLRLDKALSEVETIGSRNRASHLINEGFVSVDDKIVKSSHKLEVGQVIRVQLPEPEPFDLETYDFKLDVHYEDEALLIINKPAGLVVHPAAGHRNDTLVNALLHYSPELSMKWQERPGIVHRIDKDTTGLLVVAKNDRAHEGLVRQFQNRSVHRLYEAICWGVPHAEVGRIESWLARHPTQRKRFASLKGPDGKISRRPEPAPRVGKWAITNYKTLKTNTHLGLSLLELKLETGRTHQIRIHLSEMGHPILFDEPYGGLRKTPTRWGAPYREAYEALPHFCLHAKELGFEHPTTGKSLAFQVEWPSEIAHPLSVFFE